MKSRSKAPVHRVDWPRIREVEIKGSTMYQVDPRPHGKREYFSLLTRAKTRADQIAKERDEHGVLAVRMPIRERAELEDVKELLKPYGKSLREAVEHFVRHLKAEAKLADSKTMPEGLAEWLASYEQKFRNGKCSPRTLAEIASFVGRMGQSFSGKRVPEVDDETVREFLGDYRIDDDKVPSDQTLKNLRTKLSQFFEFARIKKWITANPCDLVAQDGVERETHILTLEAAETLLKAAQGSPHRAVAVPFVAVSLFAGLRPGEVEQLRWEDVHFDVEELDVLAATSKTGKLRHVRMQPTLVEWLTPFKQERGLLVCPAWRMKWEEVRRSIGYRIGPVPEDGWSKESKPWLPDVMRHTFASYWLPIHKSKAELALQMGNSEKVIDKHYRRTIRESVAEKFWALRPE
jgi:integrase/recombinase XerD